MFRGEISALQLSLWMILALSAPAIQLAGKYDWPAVLALILLWAVLCLVAARTGAGQMTERKWCCVLICIWCVTALGALLPWSAQAWPTGRELPVVPLVLLLLAVLSVLNGAESAAAVSGILFWIALLLCAVVIVAGAGQMKIAALQPQWTMPGAEFGYVLALPATALLFRRGKTDKVLKAGFAAYAVLFVLTLWTSGMLGTAVGKQLKWPFYQAAKTVSIFGIAERFEVLISVAATFGYYSVYSYLLCMAGEMSERIKQGARNKGIWIAAVVASAAVLMKLEIPALIPAIYSVFLWGILPVTGLYQKTKNKRKK